MDTQTQDDILHDTKLGEQIVIQLTKPSNNYLISYYSVLL